MAALSLGSPGFVSPFDASVQTKAKAQDTAGTPGTAAGSDPFSTTNLGSTFLNLLIQELKNQDPTQPVDPTQSVGQLISLNQLDQLISINQTLNPTANASATTGTGASTPSGSGSSSSPTNGLTKAVGDAATPEKAAQTPEAQAQAAQQAALQALQTANTNPSAPLNLNALSNLIGAR